MMNAGKLDPKTGSYDGDPLRHDSDMMRCGQDEDPGATPEDGACWAKNCLEEMAPKLRLRATEAVHQVRSAARFVGFDCLFSDFSRDTQGHCPGYVFSQSDQQL